MESKGTWVKVAGCVLLGAACSVAWAASITQIPPYTDQTSSQGRAITTANGKVVVVGVSGTYGIIWDAVNGTRWVLSSDNAGATICTGVAYRIDGANTQLVVHGRSAGWNTNWFSNDDGVTWLVKRRDTGFPSSNYGGELATANTLGALGLDDSWYQTWWAVPGFMQWYTDKGIGTAPGTIPDPPTLNVAGRDKKNIPSGQEFSAIGVSGTGLAVGRRKADGANYSNYKIQWLGDGTGNAVYFKGLAGNNLGQAWSVSMDGTKIFGMSPVSDGRVGTFPYMYTVATDTIVELPVLSLTQGSVTNGLPYGASWDGRFAVGMSYRGQERAALWDTQTMTVYDLTDVFNAAGLLAPSGFSRLYRAYSVATDASGDIWVTGVGIWAADSSVRGFVAQLPDPTGGAQGACCDVDGACDETNGFYCASPRVWHEGQTCAEVECPDLTGACCRVGGTCDLTLEANCQAPSVWNGNGSRCTPGLCPAAGACCDVVGETCNNYIESYCVSLGRSYAGDGTNCSTQNVCPGACCFPDDGSCSVVFAAQCPEGGRFNGQFTACDEVSCCPNPVWNTDADGDIDMDDFARLQACLTSAEYPTIQPGCECFDIAAPLGSIDLNDIEAFALCALGPEVAFDRNNPPAGCVFTAP